MHIRHATVKTASDMQGLKSQGVYGPRVLSRSSSAAAAEGQARRAGGRKLRKLHRVSSLAHVHAHAPTRSTRAAAYTTRSRVYFVVSVSESHREGLESCRRKTFVSRWLQKGPFLMVATSSRAAARGDNVYSTKKDLQKKTGMRGMQKGAKIDEGGRDEGVWCYSFLSLSWSRAAVPFRTCRRPCRPCHLRACHREPGPCPRVRRRCTPRWST